MPRTTTALQQALLILQILKCMPSNSYVTAEDLHRSVVHEGFSAELLTVQRTLKALRECGAFDIACDTRSKPYGYKLNARPDFAGSAMTPQKSLLLCLVDKHLSNQLPPILQAALDPMCRSARESLKSAGAYRSHEAAWLDKVAVIPNAVLFEPPPVTPRIFSTVSDALYRGLKLAVRYHNRSEQRIVSPLGLVQQGVRLYLVARYEGQEAFRHLAVHRIREAAVIETPAEVPEGFSLRQYIATRAFNYSGDAPKKVRLAFDFTCEATRTNLMETPFNRTQRITRIPGGWHLEAEVYDSILLEGWINTWRQPAGITNVRIDVIEGREAEHLPVVRA
ncbi:MAG: WYL domain-containing protein [Duodenibacillus sp.]|nr:WYL domain-containing protein [Duodenibacillus sp.]